MNISINKQNEEFSREQKSLIQQYDNEPFFSDLQPITPGLTIHPSETQVQNSVFSYTFNIIASVIYAAVNVIWFGIYEGVRRVIKKIIKS